MEVVKESDSFTIFKKRSGRFGVQTKKGAWISGDEKTKILVEAGLVKTGLAKPKKAVPAEKDAAEVATPAAEGKTKDTPAAKGKTKDTPAAEPSAKKE